MDRVSRDIENEVENVTREVEGFVRNDLGVDLSRLGNSPSDDANVVIDVLEALDQKGFMDDVEEGIAHEAGKAG